MNESKFASLWTRALGGAIDIAILFVFTYVVCYIWTSNALPSVAFSSYEDAQSLWRRRFILTWLIADLVYSVVLMTSDMQATLGQKVVGIKIVKDNGEKIGYGAAIGRNLMSILSSIFLKIGYAIALVRKDNKTLHDLVAGTLVIESEASFAPTISNYEQPTKPRTSSAERTVYENHTRVTPNTNSEKFKSSIKSDDSLWAKALEEFESKSRIQGLYAKLYTQHDGNEQRIKSAYLKVRFEQLKREQQELLVKETAQAKVQSELLKILNNSLENEVGRKITLNKVVDGIECFYFDDGQVAIKVTENRFRLYVNFETAETSIKYANNDAKDYDYS